MSLEDESDEEKQLRLRTAERAHDNVIGALARVDARALSYANSAMRTPGIAAAAAAAAALAFWSGNHEQFETAPDAKEAFQALLLYLGAAILVAIISPMLAYISAEANVEKNSRKRLTWRYPFYSDTRASTHAGRISATFNALSILSVCGSTTLVFLGLWNFFAMVEAVAR